MTAKNLSNAGLTKPQVKAEIMRLATRTVRDMKRRRGISEMHPMHWSRIADSNDDEARVPIVRKPENLVLFVSGGWGSGGAFCSLCPGWGGPGGFTVTQRIAFPQT
jgi:hypothetical protein